jgi:diphthine-ammonia ligase
VFTIASNDRPVTCAKGLRVVVVTQDARHAICSWSGGKDSALALQLASDVGSRPGALLTMLDESGSRSRSHGLPPSVLEAQAAALGLPLVTCNTSWDDYTSVFVAELGRLAEQGFDECVFGDIDIDDHRLWCERACTRVGLAPRHPLWQRPRRELLDEFLDRGYRATIVVVRDGVLARSFLGRQLDSQLVEELEAAGIDACGENGEYHTVVTDGPNFSQPIELRHTRELAVADCWSLQVDVLEEASRGEARSNSGL